MRELPLSSYFLPLIVRPSESSPTAGRDSMVWKQGLRYRYRRDHNMVLHLGNTRSRPGSIFRRLFLRIGTHRPMEDDLAALHFHRDIAGIRLRIAQQRPLDALLQVFWQRMRPDREEIGDAFDPGKTLDGSFCKSLLEAVFDLTLERHPALADRHLYFVRRNSCFPLEGVEHG